MQSKVPTYPCKAHWQAPAAKMYPHFEEDLSPLQEPLLSFCTQLYKNNIDIKYSTLLHSKYSMVVLTKDWLLELFGVWI